MTPTLHTLQHLRTSGDMDAWEAAVDLVAMSARNRRASRAFWDSAKGRHRRELFAIRRAERECEQARRHGARVQAMSEQSRWQMILEEDAERERAIVREGRR